MALKVNILGNAADLEKAMGGATRKMQEFGSTAIAKGAGLTAKLTVPLAGAAAGLGALGLQAIAAGDQIQLLSDKSGLSTTAIQELSHAGGIAGTDIEAMANAAGRMSKVVGDAERGLSTASDTLETLGIKTRDSSGALRDQDALFAEAVLKLQGLESETQKMAVAQDLFGRAGRDMLPVLNMSAEQFAALGKEAHNLGLVMSEESVAALDAMDDDLTRITGALKGVGLQIAQDAVPLMQDLVAVVKDQVVPWIQYAGEMVGDWIKWFQELSPEVKTTTAVVAGLAAAAGPVFIAFGAGVKVLGVMTKGAGGLVKVLGMLGKAFTVTKIKAVAAWAAAAAPIAGIVLAIGGIVTALGLFGKEIGRVVGKVAGLVVDSFIARLNLVIKGLNLIIKGVNAVSGTTIRQFEEMGYVSDRFADAGERMGEDVSEAIKGIAGNISETITGFMGMGETAETVTDNMETDLDNVETKVGQVFGESSGVSLPTLAKKALGEVELKSAEMRPKVLADLGALDEEAGVVFPDIATAADESLAGAGGGKSVTSAASRMKDDVVFLLTGDGGLVNKFKAVFSKDGNQSILKGVEGFFSGAGSLADKFSGLFSSGVGGIGGIVSNLMGPGGFVTGMLGPFGPVASAALELAPKVVGVFKSIGGAIKNFFERDVQITINGVVQDMAAQSDLVQQYINSGEGFGGLTGLKKALQQLQKEQEAAKAAGQAATGPPPDDFYAGQNPYGTAAGAPADAFAADTPASSPAFAGPSPQLVVGGDAMNEFVTMNTTLGHILTFTGEGWSQGLNEFVTMNTQLGHILTFTGEGWSQGLAELRTLNTATSEGWSGALDLWKNHRDLAVDKLSQILNELRKGSSGNITITLDGTVVGQAIRDQVAREGLISA